MSSDIYQFDEFSYSSMRHIQLSKLTDLTVPVVDNKGKIYSITDSICILRKNYRFNDHSDINQLANAINIGNTDKALNILYSNKLNDVDYKKLSDNIEYHHIY